MSSAKIESYVRYNQYILCGCPNKNNDGAAVVIVL